MLIEKSFEKCSWVHDSDHNTIVKKNKDFLSVIVFFITLQHFCGFQRIGTLLNY